MNNLQALATVLVRTKTAARQLGATRQQAASSVETLSATVPDLTAQVASIATTLRSTAVARDQLIQDNTALQTTVQSLQAHLATATAQSSRPDPSLRRLELEYALSARLQQANRLLLENQQLTLELAAQTTPTRDLSRAVRDYAATKQQDLEAALESHRADFDRQQRWLQRFEERDPDFEPWLLDDEAPSLLDTTPTAD